MVIMNLSISPDNIIFDEEYVIVGSSGFIGSELIKIFPFCGKRKSLRVDLTADLESSIFEGKVVIFLAGIKRQYGDSHEIFILNCRLIDNFLRQITVARPSMIIYLSSLAVFEGTDPSPRIINESAMVKANSFYGFSKIYAEFLLERVCSDSDNPIPLCIIRPPLVFGPNDTTRGYGPTSFIFSILNDEAIKLWGDGRELRDVVWVQDLCYFICEVAEAQFEGKINFVPGNPLSFIDMATTLKTQAKSEVEIQQAVRTGECKDFVCHTEVMSRFFPDFRFTDFESAGAAILSAAGCVK